MMWPDRSARGRRAALVIALCGTALLPVRGEADILPEFRCASVAALLPDAAVLPDGSREARLSGGATSMTARDRIPGRLCEQECELSVRFGNDREETYRISGTAAASMPTARRWRDKDNPRGRFLYFRLRPLEWVSVRLNSRREPDGRIVSEVAESHVFLDGFNASKDDRPGVDWIVLRGKLAACLDRS